MKVGLIEPTLPPDRFDHLGRHFVFFDRPHLEEVAIKQLQTG
jgi:hypothetical protein